MSYCGLEGSGIKCYNTLSARCEGEGNFDFIEDLCIHAVHVGRYLILLCACMYYYGARISYAAA